MTTTSSLHQLGSLRAGRATRGDFVSIKIHILNILNDVVNPLTVKLAYRFQLVCLSVRLATIYDSMSTSHPVQEHTSTVVGACTARDINLAAFTPACVSSLLLLNLSSIVAVKAKFVLPHTAHLNADWFLAAPVIYAMSKPRVIYWFRTDLRLHDSPALSAALDLKPECLYPIWT